MAHTAIYNGVEIDLVFRHDPTTRNGTGVFSLTLDRFVDYCEECRTIVGVGETIANAAEDAFCNEAYHDGGDEGSGNTYCVVCYERLRDEAYAEYRHYAPIMAAEQALQDQLTREDDMLAAADLAFEGRYDDYGYWMKSR